jgi:hypothetical protein
MFLTLADYSRRPTKQPGSTLDINPSILLVFYVLSLARNRYKAVVYLRVCSKIIYINIFICRLFKIITLYYTRIIGLCNLEFMNDYKWWIADDAKGVAKAYINTSLKNGGKSRKSMSVTRQLTEIQTSYLRKSNQINYRWTKLHIPSIYSYW